MAADSAEDRVECDEAAHEQAQISGEGFSELLLQLEFGLERVQEAWHAENRASSPWCPHFGPILVL